MKMSFKEDIQQNSKLFYEDEDIIFNTTHREVLLYFFFSIFIVPFRFKPLMGSFTYYVDNFWIFFDPSKLLKEAPAATLI